MDSGANDGPADVCADSASSPCFRAFTAADWERIECVPQHVRKVGHMMADEAKDMLTGRSVMEGSSLLNNFDAALYNRLCAEYAELGTTPLMNSAPSAKANEKKKRNKTAKTSVRDQAADRKIAQVVDRLKHRTAALPRWETYTGCWEGFFVAMRLWVKNDGVDILDRSISMRKLCQIIQDETCIPSDIKQHMENGVSEILHAYTFPRMLEKAVNRESTLVQPSFSGWKALTLYPEQRRVAELLLQQLRRHLRFILQPMVQEHPKPCVVRFCTPPSTGKSSAAAYIGALLHGFRTREWDATRSASPRPAVPYVFYSCYSQSVRFDVAKTCVAACVPFAMELQNTRSGDRSIILEPRSKQISTRARHDSTERETTVVRYVNILSVLIVTQCIASPAFSCYHGNRARPKRTAPPPPNLDKRVSEGPPGRALEICRRSSERLQRSGAAKSRLVQKTVHTSNV